MAKDIEQTRRHLAQPRRKLSEILNDETPLDPVDRELMGDLSEESVDRWLESRRITRELLGRV